MKYFTIKELTDSLTAVRLGISNQPTSVIIANLTHLIETILDPIREKWGSPVRVNSGYRSKLLNRAVGGTAKSQHLTGNAADITVGSPDANKRLFEMVRNMDIPFDQLIDESGYRWIHISSSLNPRRRILHL